VETGDVLAQFQDSGTEDADDVLSYWAGKRKDPRWKDLAQMALEILSIPAMSTEPESLQWSDNHNFRLPMLLGDNLNRALEQCGQPFRPSDITQD
jgi:hypothetical protein